MNPRTAEELDEVWKEWTLRLRDEQSGRIEVEHPYRQWAAHAIARNEYWTAHEHFEKAINQNPDDVDSLSDFAGLLAGKFKNTDRASKLLLEALQALEAQEEPDEDRIDELEKRLTKYDPKRRSLIRIHQQLEATAQGLAQRYLQAKLPMMAMDVSWRLGNQLGFRRQRWRTPLGSWLWGWCVRFKIE